MLSDLDTLMSSAGIGTIVVSMHEALDPSFRWLTRGAALTRGHVLKSRGSEPLLLHYPMEREEAGSVGLPTRSVLDFDQPAIFRDASTPVDAWSRFFRRIFADLSLPGPFAFYGLGPVDLYAEVVPRLEQEGIPIHHGVGEDYLALARKRKEPHEIEAIASVAERTEQVVQSVRDLLRSSEIRSGELYTNGKRLLIGDLKTLVSTEIVRLGMVEDHETIVSQGFDAAVPHSRGTPEDPVRASVPLVIDIFPADRQSGYFFDLTRTLCPGEIPARLGEIHADVLAAFERARDSMKAGTRASDYQNLVCDYFEERGYPTLRSDPKTDHGYVHLLGHGVGLQVHERPSFSIAPSNLDLIEVGDVLTIEPGLYFPDEKIGVRIEDTLWIDDSGRPVSFCKGDRSLRV
ncbi:MAG: M24 family metallopeptidase [Thermoanaerobaculia bacterium]